MIPAVHCYSKSNTITINLNTDCPGAASAALVVEIRLVGGVAKVVLQLLR